MSRVCMSCGSEVPSEMESCPSCGATMESDADDTMKRGPDDEPKPGIRGLSPGIADLDDKAQRESSDPVGAQQICSECGAANAPDATECSVCGGVLRVASESKAATATVSTAKARRPSSSPVTTYVVAGLAAAAITGIVYWQSTPEAKMGPPQEQPPMSAQAPLPPGHPPTTAQQPVATPEQEANLARLNDSVSANPADLKMKVRLANLLYDVGRHSEAVGFYRDYLKAHPDDNNVRTDMATSLGQSGDITTALAELRSVLKQEPKHQNAAFNMAFMHFARLGTDSSAAQQGGRDSVIYWLRKVAEIDSTTPQGSRALEMVRQFDQVEAHGGVQPGM